MSAPTEISEDRKQLIDALTGGYAFSNQDAEEMAELIEIGRLRIAQEDARMDPQKWLEINQQIRNAIGEHQNKRPTT